jgi:hypothetical protein
MQGVLTMRSNDLFLGTAYDVFNEYLMTIQEACAKATACYPGLTPKEINSGLCFEWAKIVFNLVEGSKIAGHNINGNGHSYIEYKTVCYDAEAPQGVSYWRDLPFFQRVQ